MFSARDMFSVSFMYRDMTLSMVGVSICLGLYLDLDLGHP